MNNRQRLNKKQRLKVQGPQLINQQPLESTVSLDANLGEKYLGRGLIGFGPSLEVTQTINADELLRQHGYKLYRQMLSDPEIAASINLIIDAISNQQLKVISPLKLDDPNYALSLELVQFVQYVLNNFDINAWRKEQLQQALTYGNAVSEMDWEIEPSGQWKNHSIITNLRLQYPEDYGFIVDRWGTVYGVAPLGQAVGIQFPLGNLIPLSTAYSTLLDGAIPAYKLSIWTWNPKSTDPRGQSMLKNVFLPWWSKQRALEEWSCWLGRYAQPSLWATPGPEALPICINNPDGSQTVTQPTESLLQALLQFKNASVLALPNGSNVNLLSTSGGAEPFIHSIDLFNKEITTGLLGQHLITGSTGGKNTPNSNSLVIRLLISSIREFELYNLKETIIKPLIEANYGDVGNLLPEIDLGSGDGFPPTVTEIAVLFQSGYFTEDQLPAMDKLLGLPIRTTTDRVGSSNLPPFTPP